MEGTGCERPACHCSSVAAAAAIATFLRIMPDVVRWGRNKYYSHVFSSGTRESLAAAVEAAAKERGDP
jgi:hypothetical protein